MGLRNLPWWARVAGKIVLSRLPVPYSFWRKLGLFRHGEMNRPERAIRTFETYFSRALEHGNLHPGFRCLELGPGDSILSGLVARAYGASHAWLVDAGSFADANVAGCLRVAELLHTKGKVVPSIEDADNLQEVLDRAGVSYLSKGTDSLAEIPDASVDFFWSQVVLEHVPRTELPLLLKELRRTASKNSIGVHSIDFKDHLGGGLNNLRFSDSVWEGSIFRNSGFYTNRLRPRQILGMFADTGFYVELINQTRWGKMPIERHVLAREFQDMPEEDFMVSEIEVLVRPT